jgi:WD40 repeat protein
MVLARRKIAMPKNHEPREFDAVLSRQAAPPSDGIVLGGLEGVKKRLNSSVEQVQLSALYEALKYGEAGLSLVIESLDNKSFKIKNTAYKILQEEAKTKLQEKLKNRRYEFFTCLRTLKGHVSQVNSICLNLDASILYSGSEDSSIYAWDWQTGEFKCICKPQPIDYRFAVTFLQSSPDGQEIIIAYRKQGIETRTIMNARRVIDTGFGLHNSFAITKNGKIIFTDCSSSTNCSIEGYDFRNSKIKYHLPEESHPIFTIAISLDGKTLFNGDADYKIKIWDLQTKKIVKILNAHSFLITALCLSQDGNTLFSGSGDYTIKIWNWRKGELKSTLTGHSYGINSLVVSPDGLTLFSASNDKTIKIWNWQTGELINTLEGHLDNVSSITISPDGNYIFSASHDNTIKVWGL